MFGHRTSRNVRNLDLSVAVLFNNASFVRQVTSGYGLDKPLHDDPKLLVGTRVTIREEPL
jgi:hypothetical protein